MARTARRAIVVVENHRREEPEMDPRVTFWLIATEQGRDRRERARERLSRLEAHAVPTARRRNPALRVIAALATRLTRAATFPRSDVPDLGTGSPTEA